MSKTLVRKSKLQSGPTFAKRPLAAARRRRIAAPARTRLVGGGEGVGEVRGLTGVRVVGRGGVEDSRRGAGGGHSGGGGRRGAAAAGTAAAAAFRRGGSPGASMEGRVSFTGSRRTSPRPRLGRRATGCGRCRGGGGDGSRWRGRTWRGASGARGLGGAVSRARRGAVKGAVEFSGENWGGGAVEGLWRRGAARRRWWRSAGGRSRSRAPAAKGGTGGGVGGGAEEQEGRVRGIRRRER
jgi:hypothetical protein